MEIQSVCFVQQWLTLKALFIHINQIIKEVIGESVGKAVVS
jgi:hypothetical protein